MTLAVQHVKVALIKQRCTDITGHLITAAFAVPDDARLVLAHVTLGPGLDGKTGAFGPQASNTPLPATGDGTRRQ